MNTTCPRCGKLAKHITQVGRDRAVVRHQSKRYEECVLEGEEATRATGGGGHVETPASGRALKNEALDELEEANVKPLYRAREYVKALFDRRKAHVGENARVSADDVRTFCDVHFINRGPWMGAVFRPAEWIWDGITHSKDPVQRGAMLKLWRHAG